MKQSLHGIRNVFTQRLKSSRRRRSVAPLVQSLDQVQSLESRWLPAGTVTGRIWIDADADGQQDAAETQTSNVTVSLLQSGNVIRSATAVNGIFTIADVPVGQTYYAQFTLPNGYTLGPRDLGSDATDNDFDVNSTDAATIAQKDFISVTEGQTLDIDAGIVQGATLTVFCWTDADGDGIQDPGAPEANGLSNVDVSLRSTGGEFYASTAKKSGANGLVTFSNVRPGTFNLVFTHPTFTRTLKDQGGDDTKDSDADQANGNTINFTLTPGGTQTNFDAGFQDPTVVTGTIKGLAWLDNGDGIRQTTETALTGLQNFELYRSTDTTVGNADDTFVSSVATDAAHNYQFTGVTPGNYYVKSIIPANYVITLLNQGADDTKDSDFSPTTRSSGMVTVAAGGTVSNVDVGFIPGTASISNFIWNDLDRDGVQDAGETGLAGATVRLFDSTNAQVGATLTTDTTGNYSFSGLQPGQYYVKVTAPLGYLISPKDQGGNDTLDSDVDPTSTVTPLITLTAGQSQTQWDAGLFLGAKVGDKVWLDTDADGVQDAGEAGKQGVVVKLKTLGADNTAGTTDDVLVSQTSTNSTGGYLFYAVKNGTYYVEFTKPADYNFTTKDVGSDATDSDPDLTTGRTATFTIANYAHNLNLDAGLVQIGTASISNFIWNDLDRDGVQDAGETGLAGATVKLFNSANVQIGSTIVTDATGNYAFNGLQAGQYYVKVTAPLGYLFSPKDQGGNDTLDSDVDPTSTVTPLITLTAGQSQTQWDAGLFLGAKVGDKVWLDTDADGVQDAGELGKQGVTVKLKSLGADGIAGNGDDVVVSQTTSNSTGGYLFYAVKNGTYYVEFTKPAGYVFTKRDIGADTTDSDAGLINGRTAKFTIANYADNLTLDAGLLTASTITVHVSPDDNGDGVLNPGGVYPGVDVLLFYSVNNIPGDSDDVFVVRGVTDPGGNVTFPVLPPANYYVRVYLPGGYEFTSPNVGPETTDSDITYLCSGYGNTGIYVLGPGQSLPFTVGLHPLPGAIEGIVWNDANRNKIRDGALLQGATPDIIFAIDISGSTSEPYAGSPVGDVNGDGLVNTILDAQILAATSLVQQLNAAGYGSTARVSVITYNAFATQLDMNPTQANVQVSAPPNANTDGDATLDVIETLNSIRFGGGSNYEAALQQALSTFSILVTGAGKGNLIFFADGPSTDGGAVTTAVNSLKNLGVNTRAFGLGSAAPLSALQAIDSRAKVYADTDDFFSAMQLNNSTGFASEKGMAGVQVYLDLDSDGVLDAGEPKTVTLDDDPDTDTIDETGIYRFTNLTPGTYVIREVVPSGYVQTHPGAPGLGWSANVTAGKTVRNGDFGNAANPNLTGLPASVSYTPTSSGVLLASAAVVTDIDNPILNGGSLSIQTKTNSQTTDVLSIASVGTGAGQIGVTGSSVTYGGLLIGTFTGGAGNTALVITLNNNATLAAVQALARRIIFKNTLAAPSTTARTIEWKLTDVLNGGTVIKSETVNISLT
ncbi:MAG: SdrD B-like domain-containing protein [Planctomycetales bacterium]